MYMHQIKMDVWVEWKKDKLVIKDIFIDQVRLGDLKNGTTKEDVEQVVRDTFNQLPEEIKSQHVSVKYNEALKKNTWRSIPKKFVLNDDKEDVCINCKHWWYAEDSFDNSVRNYKIGHCMKHDTLKCDDSTCKAWESDREVEEEEPED